MGLEITIEDFADLFIEGITDEGVKVENKRGGTLIGTPEEDNMKEQEVHLVDLLIWSVYSDYA